ncbi:MAG TPA: AraC family transcriptional regulator [Thermoanaerobaculia bacterium]|nr:AraC family transcriptional regulator [Thermoanaerobaculia bacterium]
MREDLPPGRFFGTAVGAWSFGAFRLSESVYPAHATLPRHAHARAYLGFVVHGAHRETTSDHERDCGRSAVVFHPASECHANRFSPNGGRIFRMEIDDEWLARLRVLDRPVESHGGPLSTIASRMFSEFHARDSVSSLMIESLALQFAACVARDATTKDFAPAWLRRTVDYLHDRVLDEIHLDDLAALAGVHPAHLSRVFRKHYRCSVGQYVRRLRIDLATRELAESQRPIAEIAARLGFADQSHFSRVFVKRIGLTPGRYRKLHT